VALGIDVRERRLLAEFPRVCGELRQSGVDVEVVYLEASDDVLMRRFSETRRPHPAAEGGSLADGIRREREKLRPLREVADRVVDTSALTVHELRTALRDLVDRVAGGSMTVSLVSFGYKYGLPSDADLAIDCRFLPNPFFVEELRHRTGTDAGRDRGVPPAADGPPRLRPAPLPARGKELSHRRARVHGGATPLGRVGRGAPPTARQPRPRRPRPPSRRRALTARRLAAPRAGE